MVLYVSAVMILGVQSYKIIIQVQEGMDMYKHTQSWYEIGEKLGLFLENQAWSPVCHLEMTDYRHIQKNEAFHSLELHGKI